MNLYQYCWNNPVKHIDSWGLDSCLLFDPTGPDFMPEAGHVDLAVDLPDGSVLTQTMFWGHVKSG